MELNLFEKASRSQIRFATSKGQLSVEDLWLLPLQSNRAQANLDDIAKALDIKVKEDSSSFVGAKTKVNADLKLAFDVVLRVIEVRMAEREAAKLAEERREKKAKLQGLLAKKQDENLTQMTIEEIQAALAEL